MGKGGVVGLQVETRLPGGTIKPTQLITNKPKKIYSKDLSVKANLAVTEQPRHTASLHQPDDPYVYYYLAWASPPCP
jgi:hypothetical protein